MTWLRWAGLPMLLLLLATPTASSASSSAPSSSPSPPTHTHGPLACEEHAFRVTVHRSRRDPSPTPAAPPSPSPPPADIFGEVAFPAPCVVVVALRVVTTDPLPSRASGVPSDAPGADDLTLAVTLRHDYGRHSFGLPLPPLPQLRELTSSSPAGDTPASASASTSASASSVSSLDHYMQASDGALQLEVSLRRGISVEASWGVEEALAAAELSFHVPASAATSAVAETPLGRGGPLSGDSGDSGGPPPPEAVKTERRVFGPEEDGAVWPPPEQQHRHQQQHQNAEQGKLRVALVHHYLWRGGVESLIANLCRLLPREHFEVTVVLITDWGTADQTSERARSVLTGAGCTCAGDVGGRW